MCHYITLIVPSDNAEAISAVMKRHGRAAKALANPSLAKVLKEGERQFLTTAGECDCGTVLAPRHGNPETYEDLIAKKEARMKRKGWSAAKIARTIDDMRKADARPDGGGSDSLEQWNAILHDLKTEAGLPYAGLFFRFYNGLVADEMFTATRRDVPKNTPRLEALSALQHDEVVVFGLG